MHYHTPRRTLSLESLEYRIAPAVLGLTLPATAAPLASQEGLRLPALSLTPPTPGQPGLRLGVKTEILSLRIDVGSSQASPPVGVRVDPPTLPQVPGDDPVGVLPPLNGPAAVPPVASPLLSTVLPAQPSAVSTPGTPAPAIVPLAVAAPLPVPPGAPPVEVAADAGIASFAGIGVTNLRGSVGTGDDSSPATFHSPRVNDSTFASLSALPPRPGTVESPRAESNGDEIEEELFGLRDGNLLEDFGTALGAEDAALLTAPSDDAPQGGAGNDGTGLWLVGALAAGLAGSAWRTARREREAVAGDANPCLIPLE